MLKKPFKLIHKVDINRYYTVEFDRYNRYLATESIFLLKNTATAKPKERTQAMKLLRLSAPILGLFVGYYELPVEEQKEKSGVIEKYYPHLDLKPIKEWINELIESQEDLKEGQYGGITTPDDYDNPTVKGMLEEGFEILGVIEEGSRTDTLLLVKQNPLGIFRVAELILTGKETGKSLVSMTTHTYNKEIAMKVIENLDSFSSKKSNTRIEKEMEKENKK